MPVYKDSHNGSWFSKFRYKDWTGKTKDKMKRGFKTRREAQEWETNFKSRIAGDLDMCFGEFTEIYMDERFPRLKKSTCARKVAVINDKLIPYFGSRKINEITSTDIIKWQNHLLEEKNPKTGEPYTKSYLKLVHSELNAIFSYACKYYRLSSNPAAIAGNIGDDSEIEMNFWTLDEYKKFAEVMMDNPLYFYAYEILYWTGIREGELLALTPNDFDLTNKTLKISKTYMVLKGEKLVTSPKTKKSNRTILLPDFLCDEVADFLEMLPDVGINERMFYAASKTSMTRFLRSGAKKAGVKQIRVHDLRHSHVSLLINQGYSAVAIADRLGHESIHVTYRYAHLFPSVQNEMVDKLDSLKGDD